MHIQTILKRGRKGQGLVEYVLIIGLIAFASLFAVKSFGKSITDKMSNTTTEMNMSYADNTGVDSGSSSTDGSTSGPNSDPTTGGHF